MKQYSNDVFRVVRFPHVPLPPLRGGIKVADRSNDEKLEQSRLRARRVLLEVALCNDWEFFCTFTFSPEKFNRYELFPIQDRFTQWVRDQRKKPGYEDLAYALVPEKHEDGAWHFHGFISGIPESALSLFVPGIHPRRLVDGGYLNWGEAGKKFGYCSLDRIRDGRGAAFYCTKYFTKDAFRNVTKVGGHMYLVSQGLQRSIQLGYAYGDNLACDRHISHETPFCGVGWAFESIQSWFGVLDDWADLEQLRFSDGLSDTSDPEVQLLYEQLLIADFPWKGSSPYFGGMV